MTDNLVLRLTVSLAIGLLVGMERGWKDRNRPDGSRTAGIRTYGISALTGGVFAALGQALDFPAMVAFGFLGYAGIFGWFQMRESIQDKTYSVTGTVAGMCVFALGSLAVSGDYRIAGGGGVALASILASRELLHGLLKRLTWEELRSALILMVMTTIVLPLLPDKTIDPWHGFNPWEIWLFTVITATISYIGYIATRIAGPARGLLVSGLVGAVVSSTAVTVAFANIARTSKDRLALAGAASGAAMVSILRVMSIVLILQPAVLKVIAGPALAAAAVFGIYGYQLTSHSGSNPEPAGIHKNPFRLLPLLAFAAGFGVMSIISAIVIPKFGASSVIVTSGLSGAFDVDVAVLSALRLTGVSLDITMVGKAVLAGLFANALGRLSLAIVAGPKAYWGHLIIATIAALAAGTAMYLLIV